MNIVKIASVALTKTAVYGNSESYDFSQGADVRNKPQKPANAKTLPTSRGIGPQLPYSENGSGKSIGDVRQEYGHKANQAWDTFGTEQEMRRYEEMNKGYNLPDQSVHNGGTMKGGYIQDDRAAGGGIAQQKQTGRFTSRWWNGLKNWTAGLLGADNRDFNAGDGNNNYGNTVNLKGDWDIGLLLPGWNKNQDYHVNEAGAFGEPPDSYMQGATEITTDEDGNEVWAPSTSKDHNPGRVTHRRVQYDHDMRVDSLLRNAIMRQGSSNDIPDEMRTQGTELFQEMLRARGNDAMFNIENGYSDEFKKQMLADPRFQGLLRQARTNRGGIEADQLLQAWLSEAANGAYGHDDLTGYAAQPEWNRRTQTYSSPNPMIGNVTY